MKSTTELRSDYIDNFDTYVAYRLGRANYPNLRDSINEMFARVSQYPVAARHMDAIMGKAATGIVAMAQGTMDEWLRGFSIDTRALSDAGKRAWFECQMRWHHGRMVAAFVAMMVVLLIGSVR